MTAKSGRTESAVRVSDGRRITHRVGEQRYTLGGRSLAVDRDELFELLGKYLEVDRTGLKGIRPAVEDKTPEMYVGTITASAESVWLQLDPDSCGVRSGWLVYRKLTSDKVTRQRISW